MHAGESACAAGKQVGMRDIFRLFLETLSVEMAEGSHDKPLPPPQAAGVRLPFFATFSRASVTRPREGVHFQELKLKNGFTLLAPLAFNGVHQAIQALCRLSTVKS
jgi:hypothetical protein